ncbi:glycosyltransferase family 2 protein [Phocaeicola fibrisolvens]|uniref:glycosyltransferase family 2 protein n=1 Tax=Phocaeicola fibrisolvens TaxID=2981793 RepID=UPI0008209AB5|nr:glycosyltransferase family 2 protein [Phocaeicola fibrisolvens]MCU6779085.1 glycosyltransferase family 2 protein [Phocaeicola fibrisolvens]SCI20554.1 Bactoprenol glucosyl transferase homolog from prophage CPS-53 [uncultured Bacteroides sp.]
MKKISILVPCYNEEASLPMLYSELVKVMNLCDSYDWEVLFINDGSCDNTLSVIKDLRRKDMRISYVDLSRNFGKENAMLAGFDYVTGDCMVIMDADLQHPPHVILKMLEKWEEGYEDVYAKRITRGKESWIRKRASLLFYSLLQKTTRIEILQNVGDFRLLDRCCIEALKSLRESERYTKGMFCWIGFKKTSVDFEQKDRVAGKSTWNYWSLFNLAIEGITSFTTTPLRFSSILGFIIAIFSFVLMLFHFIKALIWGDPIQGFPTLVVLILFLGGIQLLSIGILGEYLGRVFNESKHRPVYIVREYNGEKK